MNDSRECCSDLEASDTFPKHFLTTFSSSDSSASETCVESDLTDVENTRVSPGKKSQKEESIPSDSEDSPTKSAGRKRNFVDVTGEETLEDPESDVECRIPKSRRLTDCIDNFPTCDSGFPVFSIDNCLKNVQTPYCIVFPSINISTSSESANCNSARDGERQTAFSNIQNLLPAEGINELRPSIQLPNTQTSTIRFANDVLDTNNKYENKDLENIRKDEENSNGSEVPSVSQFVPTQTESCSQFEHLQADDTTDLKSAILSSQETAKQVEDMNSFHTSSCMSTVNTDTLVTATPELGTDQSEPSTTLSGRMFGPQVLYSTHPRPSHLFAEDLSFQSSLLQQKYSLLSTSQTNLSFTPSLMVKPQLLSLNSSGEEASPENNNSETTPTAQMSTQDEALVPRCLINSPKQRPSSAESSFDELHGRESHNIKERKRRARIKEACDLMRFLVPGMTEKTDKATVFEFGARYIHFLKSYVGTSNDKDFLIKYSPYY